MSPEIRFEAMAIMHEKYPDQEFLQAIVGNQVLQPFREYLETKRTDMKGAAERPDLLMKVFLHLSALWPEMRAQTVSMMQEKFQAQEFLEALVVCLNSDTLFRDRDLGEAKCRWIEEAGFQNVASLTNGGSATASSHYSDYKPEGPFVSGSGGAEDWRSYGNPNITEEYLEREMTSAVTPAILAVQSAGWKTYGPRKFKVLA